MLARWLVLMSAGLRARWLACSMLALASCIASSWAHAEPYFAVREGLKCVACHVNPTGGGLRNAFGAAWGQTALPANTIDLGKSDMWTGSISRYLSIGTNLRATANYTDTPRQKSTSDFDIEEGRLYVELAAIPDRFSIYFDQRIAPNGSINMEAYGRYWSADHTWYVKAGQLYLPYGLRLEDDSAFIRQASGINMTTPDRGVEAGLELGPWSAQLAVSNGTAGSTEVDNGKQVSLRAEFVQNRWRAGISLNSNNADAGDRQLGGVFAGLRTGPISWLAEADYIKDKGFADGERKQLVGLLEGNWLIAKGHNLKITAEHFDPDDDVDEDAQARYSIVYEFTPIQFLQLRGGLRIYDGIPQNDADNRKQAFVQMNGYF
jgi:hypothetical protein